MTMLLVCVVSFPIYPHILFCAPSTKLRATTKRMKIYMLTQHFTLVVFSKSYCPYCRASKALLTEMGANYQALELDQLGTSICSPSIPSPSKLIQNTNNRRRFRNSRRTSRPHGPKHRAKHLHQATAYWRKF